MTYLIALEVCMCGAVGRYCTNSIWPAVKDAGEQVHSAMAAFDRFVDRVDRKIDNLTHRTLPRPVAVIVATFLKTLPYIVVGVACPPLVNLSFLAGVMIFKLIVTPPRKEMDTKNLQQGCAIDGLWYSGNHLAAGIALHSPGAVVVGVATLALSLIGLASSGFFKELQGRSC
jgi:hypothetical protein